MPGHSRPKDGVLSHAYVPGIHVFHSEHFQGVDGRDKPGHDAVGMSHAPIVALTILSGSCTGSPRLILSTFSMPSMTLPQTVYWLSRNPALSKQMKNWLSPESGLLARAIDTMPRTCGSLLNSALSFLPEPPVPVPCGQPVCAMKPSITR